MKNPVLTAKTKLSPESVQQILRDIGYVLWFARKIAAESAVEKCEPVRPEMSEFCAVEAGAFAA